ncbi:hypothetical protein [Halorubellus salinus]|uniref:hypothetical protein n=1 Tax=Halorubellus salinus TaxID=755309 RepID=UPI001D07917B|nr:hypothetical protein [Halorubellus salinus]
MSDDNQDTQFRLSYLENLVILGLLINAYYYFGVQGAFIALVLALILEPISRTDVLLRTSSDEDDEPQQ